MKSVFLGWWAQGKGQASRNRKSFIIILVLTGFSPNFTWMKLFIHSYGASIIMDSMLNPIILVRWIYLTAGLVWTSQHRRRVCWDVGGKCDPSRQRYCWHVPVSSRCLTLYNIPVISIYQLCYRAFTLIEYEHGHSIILLKNWIMKKWSRFLVLGRKFMSMVIWFSPYSNWSVSI